MTPNEETETSDRKVDVSFRDFKEMRIGMNEYCFCPTLSMSKINVSKNFLGKRPEGLGRVPKNQQFNFRNRPKNLIWAINSIWQPVLPKFDWEMGQHFTALFFGTNVRGLRSLYNAISIDIWSQQVYTFIYIFSFLFLCFQIPTRTHTISRGILNLTH